jgi:hypothetical protein
MSDQPITDDFRKAMSDWVAIKVSPKVEFPLSSGLANAHPIDFADPVGRSAERHEGAQYPGEAIEGKSLGRARATHAGATSTHWKFSITAVSGATPRARPKVA